MGLVKESKHVDLVIKSEPWTEKELIAFRKIINEQKAKRKKLALKVKKRKSNQHA